MASSEHSGSESSRERWDLNPDEAGKELKEYLRNQYLSGKLSATQLGTICFLGGKGGMEELVPLGVQPDSPSGHFARHVDNHLKKTED
eukprot:5215533-Amphidinium_carterae.1